jgi:hypothetical protein
MANRPRIHPRWAGNLTRYTGPKGTVQIDSAMRDANRSGRSLMLPEAVIRLAQDEYDRQYPGQPYERMQERGGLSLLEIVGFMADRIERTEKLGPWAAAYGQAEATTERTDDAGR